MVDQFFEDVERYREELFRFYPTWATQFGDHRFDSLMPDFSRERIQDFIMKTRAWNSRYGNEHFPDPQIEVDRKMMVALTDRMILDLEGAKAMERDPSYYIDDAIYGPYLLLLYDFASLEERLLLVRERLRKIPGIFQYGKENLKDPPEVWLKIGMGTLKASEELFQEVIPSLSQGFPYLESEMRNLCQVVLNSFQDFSNFLEEFPAPSEKFSLGRDLWDEYARKVHLLDYGSEEILEFGKELVFQTEELIRGVSRRIDPDGPVFQVLSRTEKNHPSPEGLIQAYRDAISRAKSFLLEKNIVSIPPRETLKVMETPEFDRILTPYAAYLPPGPLFEGQPGIFWVTPLPSGLTPQEREEKLRFHSFPKIALTAVHEGYPGHHLQISWSNSSYSLPRKIGHFVTSLFVEGWAFYCEELMEEVGYFVSPEEILNRLFDQLFRAYRVLIDVGLHTGKMAIEEATEILKKRVGLEESDSISEVWRYTQSPTQPMTYAVGKMEILKLRKDYFQRGGGLRDFHDSLLKNGSLPLKLHRELILG